MVIELLKEGIVDLKQRYAITWSAGNGLVRHLLAKKYCARCGIQDVLDSESALNQEIPRCRRK